MKATYIAVVTTVDTVEIANLITHELISKQLTACVQGHTVHSHFMWKGELKNDPEIVLWIKTRADLYDKVEACIKKLHPYETPEIIALPIVRGSEKYLSWIDETTRKTA